MLFSEQQYTHGFCYISLFTYKSFDQSDPPELPQILDIYSVVALYNFLWVQGHLLWAQLLHWWGSCGPDLVWLFRGCSGNSLEGTVALWRILGSCCCCFLPGAAVVVPLVPLGACAGALLEVSAVIPFCLWFLGFGRVFWVVSRAPELSKPPSNVINSYGMYFQMY